MSPCFNQAQLHEDVLGSGGINPRINLGTICRWVVSITPHRNIRRNPLDRRLGGPQIRSGRGWGEKNPSPCLESNPGGPGLNI